MRLAVRLVTDESGLAGTVLVLVIAWALLAVFFLTRTLVAAEQIDQRVGFITGQVDAAAEDLDLIALAAQTGDIAVEIHREVDPLSGQLAEVVDLAKGIGDTAGSIAATATSIDETVGGINETAASILTTARDIDDNVGSINASVDDINAGFGRLLPVVGSIACGEDASTEPGPREELAIQRRACGDRGVPGINRRAGVVIALADRIAADTTDILAEVGRRHGEPADATLHGHANSIDCRLNGDQCERVPG